MLSQKLFENDQKDYNYTPSDAENVKTSFVKRRLSAMQTARNVMDGQRKTYRKMLRATFLPYADKRSSSVVPLSTAIRELYMAEATKIKTEFQFRAETSEYSTQAKAFEYVWKYDWRKNKRKKAFDENESVCAAYGNAVMYTGYESVERTQQDPIMADD